ncbi:MAG: DUF1800 domain-containing protein [Pseudomonadota bacterium]
MSVDRKTIAAIRFGYGFRADQEAPTGVEDLLAQISAGAAQPPAFADDPVEDRARTLIESNRTRRESKRGAGDEAARKALFEESQTLRRELRLAFERDRHGRVIQAVTSPHGFYERLAYFWTNHFAVRARGPVVRTLAAFLETQAIRPNIGASFRDLLGAASLHPALLVDLDQVSSVGPNSPRGARRGRGLNENLAREILELHSLGVEGGYTQADVTAFAKLLTGLTVNRPEVKRVYRTGIAEPGPHRLLGEEYGASGRPAGQQGVERALDAIAAHPSTARHISTKLARHFVADDPSEALIAAMVDAWRASDGDLMRVYAAMLDQPESWERFGDKIKTPFDYVVSGLRAVGADAMALAPRSGGGVNRFTIGALGAMNHAPWNSAGPDGYDDANDVWLTPQGLANRLEWAAAVGRRVEETIDPRSVMTVALADAARPDTRFVVEGAAERWEGVALVLASPEFNRR